MKTSTSKVWLTVCTVALAATAAFRASADEAVTTTNVSDKSFTGVIASVDAKERTINVKNWTMMHKAFNLGDNCVYSQIDKNNASASDLRPGEKVTVEYQDAHGVLVASRVEQEPMRFEGMVAAINPEQHTLTLHRTALDKELQLPTTCKVVLREGKSGALTDIKVGHHVTVTYELPGGTPTARQIAQTSIAFAGTLTAIDLNEKTVKAKTLLSSKKFSLADNCTIVINGRTGGQLSDLRPEQKLVFHYDEINGVNVVNRIAPVENPSESVAATLPTPMGY